MDYSNELYIDVEIKSENRRITIRHTDKPCDAEILLDGEKVNTRLKTLADGGAFIFAAGAAQIIITIRKSPDESFAYDCFVDGKSVQNSMPWKAGSMTVPEMTRWQKQRRLGETKYVVSETIKGILLGCVLFFILYFFENFTEYDNFHVTWVYLAFTVIPLGLLYLILSPIEFNKSERNYALFEKYLTGNDTESKNEAPTEQTVDTTDEVDKSENSNDGEVSPAEDEK